MILGSIHKREIHWPSQFVRIDISDARILAFGYDADVMEFWSQSSENRLGEHNKNLLGEIYDIKTEDYIQVV